MAAATMLQEELWGDFAAMNFDVQKYFLPMTRL